MSGSSDGDQTLPGSGSLDDPTRPVFRRPYPFLAAPEGPDEVGRLGGYRVVRLLGAGGMGYVFEAEELALRRRVALKVLKPELAADPAHRERFLREARAAAAVESDHVVTIYHVAEAGTPYLAMQFLEGESLQSRIERPEPVTLRLALEVGRQTAEGLAEAHARGLIHRDIKPANIWLETRAEGGRRRSDQDEDGSGSDSSPFCIPPAAFRVKILDFGLARRTTGETSLTSTGFIVGTPTFMAPEQASGTVVDGRADLFSLGCVLYTVLTGELPFPGNSAMAVMMALANRVPPPVSDKNPAVPREVADLVSRLLEKNPDDRPQTAREAADAFGALLAGLSGSTLLPISPRRDDLTATAPASVTETLVRPDAPAAAGQAAPPRGASPESRRWSAAVWAGLAIIVAVAGAVGVRAFFAPGPAPPADPPGPIVVGVLHSKTGTMTVSEEPLIHAALLAVDEVNAAGGVLGRQVKAVVADGKSDPDVFARQAARLLTDERAEALFGCWTSASRKAVRDVVEEKGGVLFYPVQYEGLEQSPRIVYLGPAPNQQLIPAVDYLTKTLGKRKLFLVGSDYVFPHAAHEIIKEHLKKSAGVEVGEFFLPFGTTEAFPAFVAVRRFQPDAVVNTINGGTNRPFLAHLRREFTPEKVPALSVSLTETEVQGLNPQTLAGDFLVASFFQSVDRPEAREFVRKIHERYGRDRPVTDPMAAAYTAVHLWAKAATAAGSTDPNAVLAAVRGMAFDGPRGPGTIDRDTLHASLPVRIGKIRADGQVDIVPGVGSEAPARAEPYPDTRSVPRWNEFLAALKSKWNGKWQGPPQQPFIIP